MVSPYKLFSSSCLATALRMLFDSKIPIFPSRLKAAGTVPKGISSMNLSVLNKDELNPLFPFFSKGERFFFSLSFIFFGSTSHSQFGI